MIFRRTKHETGHSKQLTCPICKVEGDFQRNRVLERHLQDLSRACHNSHLGCEFRFFPWDEFAPSEHEKVKFVFSIF